MTIDTCSYVAPGIQEASAKRFDEILLTVKGRLSDDRAFKTEGNQGVYRTTEKVMYSSKNAHC
jgi:pyruvate-formate lyase-activating enzyme